MQTSQHLISLGSQPVSNRFLLTSSDSAPQFPLDFNFDCKLGCMKLQTPFPVDEITPRFEWLTCYEPEEHLDKMVQQIITYCQTSSDTRFVGYSFKDDTTLTRLSKMGFRNSWRLDPKSDLGITNSAASIETLQDTFTSEIANALVRKHGVSDVLIARHVLEHAYDLQDYIRATKNMVRTDGYIVFEIPDCERAMRAGDCTILWEEHIHYFTLKSFRNLMHQSGLKIIFEDIAPYPLENSITLIVQKTDELNACDEDSAQDKKCFITFKRLLEERSQYVKRRLEELSCNGRIAVFGAGHLSLAFICFNELTQYVDACFDDDKNKKGLYLPVGGIPILGSNELSASQYPVCLLGLNPQHHDKIRNKFKSYLEEGGSMFSIFPDSDGEGQHLL